MPNLEHDRPAYVDPGLLEVQRQIQYNNAVVHGVVKTGSVIIVIVAAITFAVSAAGLISG